MPASDCRVVAEALAAQVGLRQPQRLDLAAAGAVEHEDPFAAAASRIAVRGRHDAHRVDDAESLAHGEHQLGAVERVQVDVLDAVGGQLGDLLGGEVGGDVVRGVAVVVEPGESLGDRCSGSSPRTGRRSGRRPGTSGSGTRRARAEPRCPRCGDAVAVAEEQLVVEEHLRDRPVGPGGDLLGEHVEVVLDRRRLRVALGVGRDGDVERAARLHGGDQIGGALVAVGVGRVRGADPFRRIAAQGDDVARRRARRSGRAPTRRRRSTGRRR